MFFSCQAYKLKPETFLLQIHTRHLRVCEQRNVGYWMAVRTDDVSGFRRVTPVTALMDTPWTCPAWPASVRLQLHTTNTKRKTNTALKYLSCYICNFFPPLSTDVNECSELNNRMSLCKNAKCINTVGSYQCVCLPGFTASDKPNYCVEVTTHQTSSHTQWAWTDTRGRQETRNHTHKLVLLYLWGCPLTTFSDCQILNTNQVVQLPGLVGVQQHSKSQTTS